MARATGRYANIAGTLLWTVLAGHAQAATVRGVVLDSVTRRPIARVMVTGPGSSAVLTDGDGRFTIDGVAAGEQMLTCRRPGYFDPGSGSMQLEHSVEVIDGAGATGSTDVTLLLEPAAAVEGRIEVPDGDTAEGMRVDLYGAQVVGGRRRWTLERSVRAESDGSFLFGAVRAGSYVVHAQGSLDPAPPGSWQNGKTPLKAQGYAPVYAPGTGELAEATVYSPEPGQVAEVRLAVHRVNWFPVRVRLQGDEGVFWVTGNGFTRWAAAFDRDSGMVTTMLPSGRYVLHGQGNGQRGREVAETPPGVTYTDIASLAFKVAGSAVDGLTVEMERTPRMQLQEAPVAGDSGAARLGALSFALVDDPSEPTVFGGILYTPASDAKKVMASLAPGRYWVTAQANMSYIASLTSGGSDLLREPLTVVAGAAPKIDAEVKTDGGTVTVALGGAVAQQDCTVELLPFSDAGQYRVERAQEGNGSVQFTNIAPGSYLVVALQRNLGVAYREPGVLSVLQGARVEVVAGGTVQATVNELTKLPVGSTGNAGSF